MSTGFKTGILTPVFLAVAIGASAPTIAQSDFEKVEFSLPMGVIVINANSILQAKSPKPSGLAPTFVAYVTAYSSSEDETDSTPFITASGTRTKDGIVASNAFPFGTRLRIPALFGDKIFIVEDRMHQRFTDRIDVWMPSKWDAIKFGKQRTEIQIVEL